MVPVRATTGVLLPALNWHATTSLQLVGHLVMHVVRRRARLRRAHIR